jgi:hypothetical protein
MKYVNSTTPILCLSVLYLISFTSSEALRNHF